MSANLFYSTWAGPSSPLTIPTAVVMSTDLIITLVLWDGMQSRVQRVEKVASHREWSKGLNTQVIPLELRKPVMFQ